MRLDPKARGRLEDVARACRRDVIESVHAAKSGNPGGCLSAADMIVYVYERLLEPKGAPLGANDRDRFVLSKGHACPVLYSLLIQHGHLRPEEKYTFRKIDSRLQTHPDLRTPGIDFTSGSLGQGLSAAVGIALGLRVQGLSRKVYALLGDGETQEGQVWEAAMSAAHFGLGELVVFLDANGFQQDGATADVMKIDPIAEKWKSFGWAVREIDGHSFDAMEKALGELREEAPRKPKLVLGRTTKGKGVSFMEKGNTWHTGAKMTDELKALALDELGGRRG